MKTIVFRLTPEKREQLKDALEKNASEITISYEEELTGAQLDKVQGGSGRIEVSDYGFGVSMPVTTSRSDGGGATVG
jgi:hypothetical protein